MRMRGGRTLRKRSRREKKNKKNSSILLPSWLAAAAVFPIMQFFEAPQFSCHTDRDSGLTPSPSSAAAAASLRDISFGCSSCHSIRQKNPRARSHWSRRYLSMQKKFLRTAARASIFPFNILLHISLSSLSCPWPRFFVACLLQLCKAVSPSKEEKSTDKNSTHARSVVRRSVGRYAARKNFKMSLIRTREFFACLPVRLPAGPSDRWSLKKGRGKMAKLLFFISAADKGKTKRPSHVIQSYIRYKLGTLLKYI